MKSQEQNDFWYRVREGVQEDDPGPLPNEMGMNTELAYIIWEYENTYIECFREKMLEAIDTPEALREYLGFKEMDGVLWTTFAHLIYSLVSRRDISNLDIVINRITQFVQMCPHFHRLRYGKFAFVGSAEGGLAPVLSGCEDDESDEEDEITIH